MEIIDIPYSAGYKISSYGDVYDSENVEITQYHTYDGYCRVAIRNDKRRRRNFPAHRLVASAFIDDSFFFDCMMFVNHRDFVRCHNHYSNLEWLTNQMNNIHRAICNINSKRITVVSEDKLGYEIGFNNSFLAAEYYNIHWLDVWDSIQYGTRIKGQVFRHRGHSDPVPKTLAKSRFVSGRDEQGRLPIKALSVRDIETGIVTEYRSMSEASKALKAGTSPIRSAMIQLNGNPRLLNLRYQIILQGEPFPEISPERLQELKDFFGKTVYVYNTKSKEVIHYKSAKEFYQTHGLSKSAVTNPLAEGKIRRLGDLVFCYSNRKDLVDEIMEKYSCR